MKSIYLFGLPVALTLAGCTSPQMQTAGSVAPAAISVASAVDPATVAKIAAVCPAVQTGLALAAVTVKGGAANTVAQAQATAAASCTAAGVQQLAANDAQPVSASNSGDSAAWLNSLLADAAIAAKVAAVVVPLL